MTVLLVQGCGGGGEGSVGASNFGNLPDSTRNIPVNSTSNTPTGIIEENFVQLATASIALLNNVAADNTAGRSDPTLTLSNVLLGMIFDIESFRLGINPPCGIDTIQPGSSLDSYLITITECSISGALITASINIDNYDNSQTQPQQISVNSNEWSARADITISSMEFSLNNKKFNYTGPLTFSASYREENSPGKELKVSLSSTQNLTVLEEIEAIANGTPTIFRDDLQNNFTMVSTYNPSDPAYSLTINGDISGRVTANPVLIQTDPPFSWLGGLPNPNAGKMTIFDSTSSSKIEITAAITGNEVNVAYDNNGNGIIDSEETISWPINII